MPEMVPQGKCDGKIGDTRLETHGSCVVDSAISDQPLSHPNGCAQEKAVHGLRRLDPSSLMSHPPCETINSIRADQLRSACGRIGRYGQFLVVEKRALRPGVDGYA